MTGSQCYGNTKHVNCVWVGFIFWQDSAFVSMEAGRTCITLDKFPKKMSKITKKTKRIKLKEKVPLKKKKKSPFTIRGFMYLMFYLRNIPQMLTQVPWPFVSNFREQLFGFRVTVLKNPHSFLRMNKGLLLTI